MEALEDQTIELSSDWLLWAAVCSLLASALLFGGEQKNRRLFFGHWAPALLVFGLYNKLLLQLCSGRTRDNV